MRSPPPSCLLTVTTTLLMMSSLMVVEGNSKITIVTGCPSKPTTCVEVDQSAFASLLNPISCGKGFFLETSDIQVNQANNEAKLKAACFSNCDKKYHKHECPSYFSATDCEKAKDDVKDKLSCADTNKKLYINGKQVKESSTCDQATGWTDDKNNVIFDFKTAPVPSIVSYCAPKPPTPCDDTSYEKNNKLTYDEPTKKLTCKAPGNELVVADSSLTRFKLVDSAECKEGVGWKGSTGETLIDFTKTPGAKIRAKCYKFSCATLYVCAGSNCQFTEPKLTCTNSGAFLEINGQWMKEAECTQQDGWKSGTKTLLKYDTYPHAKINAECHDECKDSLWEDDCPSCTAKPSYDTGKKELTCPDGHDLIVEGAQSAVGKKVTCSKAGWQLEGSASKLKDYTTVVDKLKAKCTESVTGPPLVPVTTTVPSTPSLPSTTTTTENPSVAGASTGGKKKDAAYIAVICVLVIALVVSLVLLFLSIRKNRRMGDDDTEGDSKSRSKKNEKKKGKKGSKKKNDKSKNAKKNKKNVDVEQQKPEHEMSAPDSTLPLTARVMAMDNVSAGHSAGQNPNVMDV